MNVMMRALAALFASVFLLVGLCWVVAPSSAASLLGMSLMEGLGLSSQIGDVGAFFLGAGTLIALGLKTRNIVWYQAAALLVGFAPMMRVLAWAVHGAPFAFLQIIIEILVIATLLFAASRLPEQA